MKKEKKIRAIYYRKLGYSINEISKKISVAKSTVSLWVRLVQLKLEAVVRLEKRELDGRKRAVATNNKKRNELNRIITKSVKRDLNKISHSKILDRLFCSLLYWCEGEKTLTLVAFTNSDYALIKTFLRLLRSGFVIDEKKLRVCLHLHSYHNEQRQKKFWSKITGIPVLQFIKVYQKSNTGLRRNENYQGCASIRYYDHKIAKEINYLWQLYANNGGLV